MSVVKRLPVYVFLFLNYSKITTRRIVWLFIMSEYGIYRLDDLLNVFQINRIRQVFTPSKRRKSNAN